MSRNLGDPAVAIDVAEIHGFDVTQLWWQPGPDTIAEHAARRGHPNGARGSTMLARGPGGRTWP